METITSIPLIRTFSLAPIASTTLNSSSIVFLQWEEDLWIACRVEGKPSSAMLDCIRESLRAAANMFSLLYGSPLRVLRRGSVQENQRKLLKLLKKLRMAEREARSPRQKQGEKGEKMKKGTGSASDHILGLRKTCMDLRKWSLIQQLRLQMTSFFPFFLKNHSLSSGKFLNGMDGK